MMSKRSQTIENTIWLLERAKDHLDKELGYDYSIIDEIDNIIEALEFDLGNELQ